MKSRRKILYIALCIIMVAFVITGCGSKEKKAMKEAVESANVLLENPETPYDQGTLDNLKIVVASAENAKGDDEYAKVASDIQNATKAYQDSVKQLKQITNPSEEFLIERAKTVPSITAVEAATEETDQNHLLNKQGGYTSYVAMRSDLVKDEYGLYTGQSPVEAGNAGGAVIEAFKTVEEANARDNHFTTLSGVSTLFNSGSHKVVGTLVVRTSNELTATQQQELEQNIINALIRLDD